MTPQSSESPPQKTLGEDFIGRADGHTEDDLETRRGPLIVGDKSKLLKIGIFFTILAIFTIAFLVSNIGAFPPLVALIIMTSFGLLVFIYRLRNAAHVLRLDSKGMDNRTHGFAGGFIPWENMKECVVVQADGRSMLGLTLQDEARQNTDFLTLALMDEHRKIFKCDVVLPPEVFGVDDPARYAKYLNRFITSAESRKQLAEL
jgi:hypothetical protein